VVVPGEHQPVCHGIKNLLQSSVVVRRSLEEPKILDVFWIEPGFNMGEIPSPVLLRESPQ
jgi:hypothetical protein